MSDNSMWWLWIENGKVPVDWQRVLHEGIQRFQGKPTWRGQRPGVVAIHPSQAGAGIEAAAAALHLRVVHDRLVAVGTFRLGLDSKKGG